MPASTFRPEVIGETKEERTVEVKDGYVVGEVFGEDVSIDDVLQCARPLAGLSCWASNSTVELLVR